jgi:hypothetical protein
MLHRLARRSASRFALLVAAFAVVAACSDDDPVSPPAADGTYLLASIQEQGLAACTIGASGCTLANTGTDVIVVGDGTLVLLPAGTFSLVVNGSTNGTDEELGSAAGTWVRTQTGVTLSFSGLPITLPGTIDASGDITFVVSAALFSPSASGNVTIRFDKQ